MNRDEQTVDTYLRSLGLGEVAYEPDGSVPPDFLVEGRIAVEVRRLNQHYDAAGRARGLEEDSVPLQLSFERLLTDFGPSRNGRSWFVFSRIQRPIPQWKLLRPVARAKLRQFLHDPRDEVARIGVESGFEISVIRASTVEDRVFLFGGNSDLDTGGWVVSEIVRNLSVYVPEKTRKVAPYRHKYSSWWLIFVDYIGYASDEAEVRQYFTRPADWNRLLLLSALGNRAYEIYNRVEHARIARSTRKEQRSLLTAHAER